MKTFSFATMNIHKGLSSMGFRKILPELKEIIRDSQADIVCLQEVQSKEEFNEPQFETLSDELFPHYSYGKNAVYRNGHHGNAVLSKWPISKSENLDISLNQLEKRGILHCEIPLPGYPHPLHTLSLHLNLFERHRREQTQRLIEKIRTSVPESCPLIIGGDFNDWRNKVSDPLQSQVQVREAHESIHGHLARTFPSWLPLLSLDRIYFKNLKVLESKTLDQAPKHHLSDHLGLVSVFQIPDILA